MNYKRIANRPDLERRDEHYTKFDVFERHLIKSVAVIAAYDCPQHDPKTLCSCPTALAAHSPATKELLIYIHFVQAWEQWLLNNDAAFIFTDDYNGKKWFQTLRKQSAQFLVIAFAKITFRPGMLAPAGLLEDTIGAMLAFWDDRASTWKSKFGNKEAARRDLKACLPGDAGSFLYGRELEGSENIPRHKLGQGLLVTQRFLLDPHDDHHRNEVFLLPLLPRVGNSCVYLRHKLLGVRRCHENCGQVMPALKQLAIEGFRNSRSPCDQVNWGFDEIQRSILNVTLDDPVDGAS
ncbi:uncharacterized protein RCC_04218 [Ramularia collo-cygni]|uniref:Uncharacterized protein n=1 Tax=Ramularia collo-cygni TaxID=112498 RepID=A0A2D3V751_9PEZI|nr:uncharacterized protein RCC_04218 [Ramularia collo-cygni]CZT18374.1 uncharacterized protein RCC_04218 [Ramularia collo-cygni]